MTLPLQTAVRVCLLFLGCGIQGQPQFDPSLVKLIAPNAHTNIYDFSTYISNHDGPLPTLPPLEVPKTGESAFSPPNPSGSSRITTTAAIITTPPNLTSPIPKLQNVVQTTLKDRSTSQIQQPQRPTQTNIYDFSTYISDHDGPLATLPPLEVPRRTQESASPLQSTKATITTTSIPVSPVQSNPQIPPINIYDFSKFQYQSEAGDPLPTLPPLYTPQSPPPPQSPNNIRNLLRLPDPNNRVTPQPRPNLIQRFLDLFSSLRSN